MSFIRLPYKLVISMETTMKGCAVRERCRQGLLVVEDKQYAPQLTWEARKGEILAMVKLMELISEGGAGERCNGNAIKTSFPNMD